MPIEEPRTNPLQVEYPDCPHLTHGHCRWLSERFGQPHFLSPIACQFICRQHGPFAGQPLEPEAEGEYTALMFDRRYNFPGGFLQRVLGKYDTQVRITVPEQWPAIRQAMTVVENEPWFDGVGLTGSLIVDGQTDFKDYDIVLFVRDFDAVARDKDRIEAMLPDQIDGVRADYFFITERHTQFFVVLSPDESKVYASRWFRPKVELAAGLELIASDNPACDLVAEKLRDVAVPSDLAWMRVTTRQGRNVIMKSNGKSKPYRRNSPVTTARELRLSPARQHLRAPGTAPRPAGSSQASPPLASLEEIAEAKRRFDICKTCENARDGGFACTLHSTCCFGKWRGKPQNHCPIDAW